MSEYLRKHILVSYSKLPTNLAGMASQLTTNSQGVFSGIIGNEHFLDTMNHPNDSLMGIIVSIYNLGCFSGCIINFFIGDKLGRRRCMWFAMGWIIVRWLRTSLNDADQRNRLEQLFKPQPLAYLI